MTNKIASASPEQWAQIDELKEDWISKQTNQYSDEDMRACLVDMWHRLGQTIDPQSVVIVDSPGHAWAEYARRHPGKTVDDFRQSYYSSLWWGARAGWYKGAEILGVKFDTESLDFFCRWIDLCSFVVVSDPPIVSRRPTDIHWEDGELHCDDGMAVEYADGWGLYAIRGVRVDEQIVMSPETQTVEQIRSEENEEVRRIRIERYGWERYLTEANAMVIETRKNHIENTHEALMDCDGMRILVCGCPSTARVYALEVPSTVESCSDAQSWIRNVPDNLCIGAT